MPESGLSKVGLHCDLLVFDLDGTLIDSQQDLSNAVNATLESLHRPVLERARIADFIGDGAAMLLVRALEATGGCNDGLIGQALPFFLNYYRAHKLDSTYVYPGVIAELERILEVAPCLPMAILANKPVGPSLHICEGLGLSRFFFANYGGDSFPTKKPDPLGLQSLITEAGRFRGAPVSAARTVLVGDSHVDVETARAAGVRSLGCTYGFGPTKLLAASPDEIANTPSEWLRVLQTML